MARKIATREIVFEAASQLVANGEEPTTVSVQAHIGGGSFTTVKRYLDEWTTQCIKVAQETVEVPVSVTDKGAELTRSVWAMAVAEASKQTQAAEKAATLQIAALKQEQAQAHAEIARLEELEETQYALMETYKADLAKAQANLAQAHIELARIPELQERLATAQAETAAARHDATEKAVAAGRLSGESESLRSQVRELTSALVALKSGPPSPPSPSTGISKGNAP